MKLESHRKKQQYFFLKYVDWNQNGIIGIKIKYIQNGDRIWWLRVFINPPLLFLGLNEKKNIELYARRRIMV